MVASISPWHRSNSLILHSLFWDQIHRLTQKCQKQS